MADTDAEAERLYCRHVNYFYNRCLHVYPGFADAPGYRTIKTIQTGALSQFTQAAARDYPNMTWKDLVDGRYVIAGSPETVRQQMEELIKSLRVGNIFCLMHVGNMPNDKVRHSTQAVRREGDAAPAQPVARLEEPRRPLLDASNERARAASGGRGMKSTFPHAQAFGVASRSSKPERAGTSCFSTVRAATCRPIR